MLKHAAITDRVLHDTRSTSTSVRSRKREPEEERRGERFLARRAIMRAGYTLMHVLCAEIYVDGDTFLSA